MKRERQSGISCTLKLWVAAMRSSPLRSSGASFKAPTA